MRGSGFIIFFSLNDIFTAFILSSFQSVFMRIFTFCFLVARSSVASALRSPEVSRQVARRQRTDMDRSNLHRFAQRSPEIKTFAQRNLQKSPEISVS